MSISGAPKAAVIVFPGSNCDRDVAVALEASFGTAPAMIWHREPALPAVDLVVLPGGFSYGDYLRSGAMAARSPVMQAVAAAAGRGVAVLGICNGFQILTEAGLLPGVLMRNPGLRFQCHDVWVKPGTANSVFTAGLDPDRALRFPIAHNEGSYFADDATMAALEDEDRIAFRYSDAAGAVSEAANPNRSRGNVAGILSRDRNVLGLMPHPERAADPALGRDDDGRRFFAALAGALAGRR